MHPLKKLVLISILTLNYPGLFGWSQTAVASVITDSLIKSVKQIPTEETVRRIAVMPLQGDRDGDITHRLTTALVSQQQYAVIDRQQLDLLLDEANFQMGELVDPQTAVSAGRIAGVDAIVYGTVKRSNIGQNWADLQLHLQITKVENAHTFWADDVRIRFGQPSRQWLQHWHWWAGAFFILGLLVWAAKRRPRHRDNKVASSTDDQQISPNHPDSNACDSDPSKPGITVIR